MVGQREVYANANKMLIIGPTEKRSQLERIEALQAEGKLWARIIAVYKFNINDDKVAIEPF